MQALSDAVGALARRRFRLPAAGADRERARAALRRPLERALADLAGAAEVGEGAVGEVCHVLEGLACLIRTEFGAGDELQRALAAACVRVCSLCLDVVEQRCLDEPAGGGGVCARLLGVVRCLSGDAGDVDVDRVALRVQEDAEDFEGPESVRAGGPGADPGAGAAVRLAGDLPAADVGLGFGVQFEEVAVQAFSALSVTPRLLRLVTRLVRGLEADGGASRAGVETLELAVRCYRNVVGLLCKWDVGDKHLYEIKDLNALTESVCRLFPVAPAPEGAPAAGRAPIEGLYGELLETLRGHPSRKVQQAAAQFAKLRASQLWEQYLGACPSPREFVRADGRIDAELAERTLRGYSPKHLLVALAASEEAIHALQDNFEVTYLDAAATEKHFAALSALLMCACHGTDGEWPEIQRQCADQIAAYFEAAPNAAVRNLVAAVLAGSLAMQGGEQGKTGGTRIVRRATDVLYQVVAGNIGSHSEDPDTSADGLLSSLLRPEAPYVAQEVALTTLIKVVNSSLAADLAWATVEKVWRLLLGSPHMVSLLSKNAHSLLKALPEQSSGQLIRATIEKAKEDFRAAAGEGSASHPGQVLALIPGELLPAGVVSDVLDAAVRAAERAFAGPYSKAGFANAVAMLESAASLYRMEHRGDLDVPAAGRRRTRWPGANLPQLRSRVSSVRGSSASVICAFVSAFMRARARATPAAYGRGRCTVMVLFASDRTSTAIM